MDRKAGDIYLNKSERLIVYTCEQQRIIKNKAHCAFHKKNNKKITFLNFSRHVLSFSAHLYMKGKFFKEVVREGKAQGVKSAKTEK